MKGMVFVSKKICLVLGLVLFFMAMVTVAGAATVQTSGNYEYIVLEDNTVEIVKFHPKNLPKKENIPAKLGGHTVSRIGNQAFYDCGSLFNITIPNSVVSIGENAFCACKSLTSITIPDHVISIGKGAFSSCTDLEKITIPNSVTSIGDSAFYSCPNLTSFTIPDSVTSIGDNPFSSCKNLSLSVSPSHPTLAIVDGVLFSKADHRLIYYPMRKQNKQYTIPQGTQIIGYYAFNRAQFTSIIIPDSVTYIAPGAFSSCKSLKSVCIPDGVTSISEMLFINCDNLSSIIIPDSVTSIESDAFMRCKSLKSITIPDSVTSIGPAAFWECGSLASVVMPNGITSIETELFYKCQNLTSVSIPDSVTSIGKRAFMDCKRLSSVYLPGNINSIGQNAFRECYGITFMVDTDSYALQYCKKNNYKYTVITGLIQGDYEYQVLADGTAEIIGLMNRSLESVDIPVELAGIPVSSIGDYAFQGCTKLSTVSIPDSVTSIGANPFVGTSAQINISLDQPALAIMDDVLFAKADKRLVYYPINKANTEYTIPYGIQAIGDSAFAGCKNLGIVDIPNTVTSIGASAFESCSNLTIFKIPNGVTQIKDKTFRNCTNLLNVLVPDGLTAIGSEAFSGISNTFIFSIPANVISIGENAFANCPNINLHVTKGSYAEQYCKDNNIPYTRPDVNDWLTSDTSSPVVDSAADGTEGVVHIDFKNDVDFEAALNRGENTIGKVVCFRVLSVHPNSAYGYNLWAGDHLNFITQNKVDPVQGDRVLAKVTGVYTKLKSWFISYEILGINVK